MSNKTSKLIYISADYDENNGDHIVVEQLKEWVKSNKYSIDFCDAAEVSGNSISTKSNDCRICDLKAEFNAQINHSSIVIFIIGDHTKDRVAGQQCNRNISNSKYECTPYKQNSNGLKECKYSNTPIIKSDVDVGYINQLSYLQHEFEQARRKNKKIVILYNSSRKESNWLPDYMKDYEENAIAFWIYNETGNKIGNYQAVKDALDF